MAVETIDRPERVEGRRLALQPLDRANLYQHFEWSNDPDLNKLQSEIPFEEETLGEFKSRFERLIEVPSPLERHFEIHEVDGAIVGVAYVGRINQHNRNCLVSITIGDESHRGQGYGREALELVMRFCFEELGMHRVYTETFEYNDTWQSLVEGMGFRHEGTEREYLYREGRFWDKAVYGILEDEYSASDRPAT